jgi:hypothetical protein
LFDGEHYCHPPEVGLVQSNIAAPALAYKAIGKCPCIVGPSVVLRSLLIFRNPVDSESKKYIREEEVHCTGVPNALFSNAMMYFIGLDSQGGKSNNLPSAAP